VGSAGFDRESVSIRLLLNYLNPYHALPSCSIHRQSRNPPILPPSLALTCFPSPSSSRPPPPALSHMMSLLLPLSLTLPLSLPLLNTSTFTPEYKNEDLHAGYLQLPVGCTVLVTESGVAEGKVIEKGVMSFTFHYILLYAVPHETDADCMFYGRYYEPQSSARRDELSITSLCIPIQPILVSYRLRVRGFGRRQKKRFFPSTSDIISSCATVDIVLISTNVRTSTDEYHTPSPTAQKQVRR
jgi:hypothetical protein